MGSWMTQHQGSELLKYIVLYQLAFRVLSYFVDWLPEGEKERETESDHSAGRDGLLLITTRTLWGYQLAIVARKFHDWL